MGTKDLGTGPHRWADWTLGGGEAPTGEADRARLAATPFLATARASQRPPPGDWRTWLFMAGRGAGKSRAGAEWTRFAATQAGLGRIALVGPTLSDVREVMIEGPSGLKAVSQYCEEDLPVYQVSRRRLEWPNGAPAHVFSAEDPDSLRGPQFDAAWCDEAAAWRRGPMTWDMLQMALRLGPGPRAVVTTTPRPVPLIQALVAAPDTVITHGRTRDNAGFLSASFLSAVEAAYGGTALGRQELDGILLSDKQGALWTANMLAQARTEALPHQLETVVVAVDPPATDAAGADECGILAVGRLTGSDGEIECYVLADASEGGLSPLDWARRAVTLAETVGASQIIAETNQGGDMVVHTLQAAGCRVPVLARRASLSKRERAVPVALRYEQGRVKHVGAFPGLEEQLLLFGTDGQRRSPDRLDALVWAITVLAVEHRGGPKIRRL